MADPFDAYQYLGYLRGRWRFIAVACAVGASGALAVSLLLPKRFTATARLLIEPAAGADPRSAMAVSPIYLESLRTYEHFASSDSLFSRALAEFHLRERLGNRPVESLKQSVLRVSIPRNTKILEIRITLQDARTAHALALYLAEETVKLNRAMLREGDRELSVGLEKQYAEARSALDQAEASWSRLMVQEPVTELEAEVDSQQETRSQIKRQLLAAELDVAGYEDQTKHPESGRGAGASGWLAEARARVELLRKQLRDVETSLRLNGKLLAARGTRLSRLERDRKSRQAAVSLAENRLQEARGAMGYRGERLEIVDPGIVPERPSFPNLPLNVLAAALVGLIGSWLYLSVGFGHPPRRAAVLAPERPEAVTRR